MHCYVEKQVFSWCDKKVQFFALLRGKAGFLMTWPKTKCIQDALLRFKAGFLMTRQKLLYLMHFYVEKQVFLMTWPKTKCIFDALLRFKAGFLMTRQKLLYLMHFTWKSRFSHDVTENKVYTRCIITFQCRFSHDAPNTLIFDALLRGKAGFLMIRQKSANLLPYYVSKQVFSWCAKNSYIWCNITWKSRFSCDAPKTLTFDALLRGKTGFLMMR